MSAGDRGARPDRLQDHRCSIMIRRVAQAAVRCITPLGCVKWLHWLAVLQARQGRRCRPRAVTPARVRHPAPRLAHERHEAVQVGDRPDVAQLAERNAARIPAHRQALRQLVRLQGRRRDSAVPNANGRGRRGRAQRGAGFTGWRSRYCPMHRRRPRRPLGLASDLPVDRSARGRTRTCTGISPLGSLSPMRLPISPPERWQRRQDLGAANRAASRCWASKRSTKSSRSSRPLSRRETSAPSLR